MTRTKPARRALVAGTAFAGVALAACPALAVVPNETTNAEDIVDRDDVYRGVGMLFRADGFVCTGTLINPRTVLFAAHCVNDRPATDYNSDNVPAAWSFNVDAFPGFASWITNGFASNSDLAVFNVNRIFFDPRSLQNPAAGGFGEADIALASLDTPAAGIPTWALLFSTLPAPAAIDPVRGTGYHVDIVGYGATGNALEGAFAGIDFRRRAAENLLGGFFSFSDRNAVVFGAPNGLTQNLYHLDFDSQNRSAAFDFNVHRDDALPREGITAIGDSGGPLILDAANNRLAAENLVIGVLSGGSRFLDAQAPSSLGSVSFYQPLSLFWQYILETNPYRYVGAARGNGNWEDEGHWVTLLDPVYRVIGEDGQVVNGVPTTPELGLAGTGGDFGAVCAPARQPGGPCVDLAAGGVQNPINPAGGSPPLPGPTLTNGLPGASGFVPDNVDPVISNIPGANVTPRYFDVTLSEPGATTLGSAVTIDRLTVRGDALLAINAAGHLRSLTDVNQFGGRLEVGGALTALGDYTLFGGKLEGTGTVAAPFLTSIAGVFAPGTIGTTGTLTIDGNLVMASGTNFLVDIGSAATSDRLAVTGFANVGGIVTVGPGMTQQVNGRGQRYTIVTGAAGVSGEFTAQPISAILGQSFFYQDNAVLMEVTAQSYGTVIDTADPAQVAYARLFDQNRMTDALASLYGLDFAAADTIRNAFAALAPVNEQAVRSMTAQTINLIQNANRSRLREADKSKAGGMIAVTGAPLGVIKAGLSPARQPLGADLMGLQSGGNGTTLTKAGLPDDVAIVLSGGYLNGSIDSAPGFARKTDVSGLFVSGGIEFYPGEQTMIGLSGYFSALDAATPLGRQVRSETYAASLIMRRKLAAGVVIGGQMSLASIGFDSRRQVTFLGVNQTLTSQSDDLLISGALGVSYDLETSLGTISPGGELRYARADWGTVREAGGTLGLAINRSAFESAQARAGVDYASQGQMLTINGHAQLVREFADGPQQLDINFVAGTGPHAGFLLNSADTMWGEVGVSARLGDGPLQVTAGFDTTIGRDDANAQVIRVTATYRF